ncbi:hypothetical protein QQZ08_010414 [Neonectria magnoliae]|uniref:Amidase domain-containing protein n=1 Tax=Neonectria magnoliae TaxID=2732573 RepID=A0ABR1HHH0_9HYPO
MPMPGRAVVSQGLNVALTAVFIAWSLANLVVYSLANMVLTITATSRTALTSSDDQSWSQAARKKNEENDARISENWRLSSTVLEEAKGKRKIAGPYIESLLDDETRSITALDVPELIESMRKGSLSAVQVVSAFCKRAAYAHQLNRNLLEIGFHLGLKRARELDAFFSKHNKLIGPLHGIPITLKDQFHIKDMETTMGYIGWIGTFEGNKDTGNEKVFESQIIQDLQSLGAVPIGKVSGH